MKLKNTGDMKNKPNVLIVNHNIAASSVFAMTRKIVPKYQTEKISENAKNIRFVEALGFFARTYIPVLEDRKKAVEVRNMINSIVILYNANMRSFTDIYNNSM